SEDYRSVVREKVEQLHLLGAVAVARLLGSEQQETDEVAVGEQRHRHLRAEHLQTMAERGALGAELAGREGAARLREQLQPRVRGRQQERALETFVEVADG